MSQDAQLVPLEDTDIDVEDDDSMETGEPAFMSCPNCWQQTPMPELSAYNSVHHCQNCSTPHLVHDTSWVGAEIDPRAVLAASLGQPLEAVEFYVLQGFDVTHTHAEVRDRVVHDGELVQDKLVVDNKLSAVCTFYAARRAKVLLS